MMKTIIKRQLLVMVVMCCAINVWAQQKTTQYNAYCEVTVRNSGMDNFINITFDFGLTRYPNALIYDEKGQPIKFRSPMDAVNYLGERGWRLVTSYYSDDAKGQVRHYILEKKVTNRKQMEEGLKLESRVESQESRVERLI